ncbi:MULTISPECIES: glucosaminidase domain-containing protein [Mesonia]|uniref:Autolysin n=1 Tax=Mesonia oceanica TaxID=2687242 RepID=A0AC61Y5U6_9FLAO|nr:MULTISPECIES: glucosaminidase domain-containing protein [Mesonia]MAN26220.1 N-acetylmuramidase [Mesonia sp.]MAQ42652.1 N-acetylmuramidase [Mesonia sp.]MBJ99190.1 N-acetylmuramidase [Flavobacteriaceae bacterium]VVU99810.1 Autolysin [Mesonia oceanica]|tara:strand:- start:16450 stop:17325 length:876 start_codon:yes stop_codon:yes gene_type:complete
MKLKLVTSIVIIALILSACGGAKKKRNGYNKRKRAANTEVVERPKSSEAKTPKKVAEGKVEEINETESSRENNAPVFKNNVERYVYNFADIAKDEMKLYGIPASITLAQGVLESNAGQGELTLKSNNHFGIKCNGWQGEKVYHDDDALDECFRKYNNPKYSFRDHSLFLTDRRRYAALFKLNRDDYKAWAYGLKSAGYATDPKYPAKLISIIERYELYKYDDEVLGNGNRKGKANDEKKVDYTSIRYTVKKGDTLYSISKKYGLSIEELKKLNNLKSNNLAIGQKLYVKSL